MQRFMWSRTAMAFAMTALVACGEDGSTGPVDDNDGTVVGTVDASGGTLTADGGVTLDVPAGAVESGTVITVDPTTDVPASSRLVEGTAFEFGPDGLDFDAPVELTLEYDEADLPAGQSESSLGIYKATSSGWQEISWVHVDTVSNRVTARISSFSAYALLAGRVENVDGTWTVASVDGPNTCGDPLEEETLSVVIEQDGASIDVFIGGAEFTGTVDGSEVHWSGSYPEDGGTTTNLIHVVIVPGGDAFSGESEWTWTDGDLTCTGGSTFVGTRD